MLKYTPSLHIRYVSVYMHTALSILLHTVTVLQAYYTSTRDSCIGGTLCQAQPSSKSIMIAGVIVHVDCTC
jgi:hypothetical protein